MRHFPVIATCALLITAVPAGAADAQPGSARAEVPPPPPMIDGDTAEPQVTIVTRGNDRVEEYRVNGKLYMMKVTPPHGKPYYLVDNKGDGQWLRQDDTSSKLSVPMWVITTF